METATQQTIRVNDLRISNWVELKVRKYSGIGRVHSILPDKIKIGDGITSDLKSIYPIELSPKILGKCGFFFNEWEGIFEHGCCKLICFDSRLFCFLSQGREKTNMSYIQHLHQLQNLYFSLTRTELPTTSL